MKGINLWLVVLIAAALLLVVLLEAIGLLPAGFTQRLVVLLVGGLREVPQALARFVS